MTETRTCAECGTSLLDGVTDVFCPACALRAALAAQNAQMPQESKAVSSFGWLDRFKTVNRLLKRRQKGLASTPYAGGESTRVTTAAPEPGEVFEDYEILEKIGGNMGLVFRARHRLLDKIVALKFFPADFITDPARLTRFQRELRAMGQLQHPNLVTAADARIVGCWHMVAMELIEGTDLQRLVQLQGPLQVAAACEMARQAALGLQYAHEHGLIHRDIKPSNLMLTHGGTIKVIDMGLALSKEETQLTQQGSVLGTMSYCAPEQVRDASQVDIRADIYSLGCTLYHLLAGKPPYSHRTTFTELAHAHIHEPFPSLTAARPDAPAELEAVLARMTAKEPDARFSTPQEVAAALQPFARSADLRKLVPTDQPPLARPAGSRTPGRRTEPTPKTPWAAIAALLAVLLAIAVAWGIFSNMNRQTRNPGLPVRDRAVVVVIDTSAERGVYDDNNKNTGITNGEEIKKALKDLKVTFRTVPISIDWIDLPWRGERTVYEDQPEAVAIHRSAGFHPVAAGMELTYPPFSQSGSIAYKMCDVALASFMANIASQSPRTRFLIYSRGTDPNWTNQNYRVQWVKDIEEKFPWLKDRISTMWIREGKAGRKASFRNPETAEDMRNWITTNAILRLKDK